MRYIQSEELLDIPEGVKIAIKKRIVTVEGPRGKLSKDLSHLSVSFSKVPSLPNTIKIELYHGVRKSVASLRTVRTLINNLIIGVTKGYLYKMRYVYAHFPINVNVETKNGITEVEIRNFIGEKITRRVRMHEGVEVTMSANVKDQLELSGNSLDNVSQSAASIQQICKVRNKDIRKFLDGLYVSERGNVVQDS